MEIDQDPFRQLLRQSSSGDSIAPLPAYIVAETQYRVRHQRSQDQMDGEDELFRFSPT
jgi:hypothetical protein